MFNKIALSDAFMFVGHCQASPGTWHNRNQIRGARLTIPIKNDMGVSINDTEFVNDHWKRKHLRSIEVAYSKRPFFSNYFDDLKYLIETEWAGNSLGHMNMALIEWLCMKLRIETEFYDSQFFETDEWGNKTEMLIDMCEAVGADHYLSNEGSRAYVDELLLEQNGIKHLWQQFKHPVYDQGHPEFIPDLSVIDLLFNMGPEAGQIVRGCGSIA